MTIIKPKENSYYFFSAIAKLPSSHSNKSINLQNTYRTLTQFLLMKKSVYLRQNS
jgi:hypothetical protein